MTRIGRTAQDALNGVKERKAIFDKERTKLEQELTERVRAMKSDLAIHVLDALDAGVPQMQISKAGLGYTHPNGIRSFFALSMSGNVSTLLREQQRGGLGGALDVIEDQTIYPLFYRSEDSYDGTHQYKLEREDRELKDAIFVDGDRVIWKKRDKVHGLTAAEYALVDAQFPEDYKARYGWGESTDTND